MSACCIDIITLLQSSDCGTEEGVRQRIGKVQGTRVWFVKGQHFHLGYSPVSERSRRDSKMRVVGELLEWTRLFRNCNVM